MSTLNSVANGARLDDCHSTIFSLADLKGIKWHKFSSDAAGFGGDPVLSAFTKCLALDILAVWRRAPRKSSDSNQLGRDSFAKELWVFWWGHEPQVDDIALLPGLKNEDNGCWEDGLSYECRTLLFKAIHNLVERCLLHENFVRIGQWFVKPLMSKEADEDVSDRFSFSFSFFLHGESSVCTTVEVARHKSLERLTYQSFQQINANNLTNSAILVPYGLEAKLSGISYRSHDPVAKKLLEEWKSFYPIGIFEDMIMDDTSGDEDHIDHIPIPPVVEVIIGGFCMNYPSYFVLLPSVEPASTTSVATNKSDNGFLEAERCFNVSKNLPYEQLSAPSVSEFSSEFQDPTKSTNAIKSLTKSAKGQPQLKENLSQKSRYFANRLRVKNKSVCATVQKQDSSNPSTTVPEDISTGLRLDNNASGNSIITWHFEDLFKKTRFLENVLNRDSSKPSLDRPGRSVNYGSFHHRNLNDRNKKNYQNAIKLPSHELATPKDSLLQDSASETVSSDFLLQTQNFQIPPDKLTLSEDPSNKFHSKPFVSLGSVSGVPGWLDEEAIKVDPSDFPSFSNNDSDQAVELSKLVDAWKTYQLPTDLHSLSGKQKRLHADSLDGSIQYGVSSRPASGHPCAKRLKDSSSRSGENVVKSDAQTSVLHQPCTVQQVSVGAVNGELAGMALSSDPYAFDDVEDTINQPSKFSEISLKPPSQSSWQSMHQSMYNGLGYDTITNGTSAAPPSGKSELEFLLRQTTSPAASTAMPVTSVSYTNAMPPGSSNPSKTLKEQLEFSMEDLDDAMEKEDSGVPTPPDDPCDNHINDHAAAATTVVASVNPVSSNAVVDLQQMFPTPPSFESCQPFSPEGRVLHPVAAAQGLNASGELDSSVMCKRENDKLEITSGFSLADHHSVSSSAHAPSSVLLNKMLIHPRPELYQPLSLNSQLPPQHPYVPSWMLPSNISPDDCIATLPAYTLNPPVTPNMASLSTTPCTPGHSSVRTPASVQPSSVPTPGRVGLCSIESSQSYQTPNSHGPNKTQYRDHHGSAALHMNLLLSDSVMNLFRDKSFDQCALCVCNMNIRGADVELGYLPAVSLQEAQYPCSCGFSAVRNRLSSVGTGLFLEDELDIVGLDHESEVIDMHKQIGQLQPMDNDHLFSLILEHCSSPFSVSRLIKESYIDIAENFENVVTKRDEREALAQALSIGLSTMEQPVKIDGSNLTDVMHPWKQTHSDVLTCGSLFDLYRLLVSLKPVLQDAIQRKRTTRSFGFTQHVKGPLTWREFCKEAGKNAEPQPIPSFVVGYDHDWLVVSPHALKYWEKLFLEPYSEQRDIVYLVVSPDDDQLVGAARIFFRELSSMFESCRLGRLKPYNKKFSDGGIVRVGHQAAADQCVDTDQLSWLSIYNSKNGGGDGSNLLSLYARAFVRELRPLLKSEQNLDLSSLHVRTNQAQPPTPSVPIHTMSGDRMANITSVSQSRPSPASTQSPSKNSNDSSTHNAPYNPDTASVIALFIVDPFGGSMSHALWRCYHSLLKSLPSPVKNHLLLQIVPVDTVLQATSSSSAESFVRILRSLAFSTFSQCRSNTPSSSGGRSMTGFAPKLTNRPLNTVTQVHDRSLYAPLYILADPHEKRSETLATTSRDNVLFVSYCLSRDQKWLLATATDQCGEMLERCCINIDVPPRRLASSRKHRRISVRSGAIEKLWKFCEATCLQFSCSSWRIVIGKLGRLSHAEIQDWAKHLSRRTLQSFGKQKTCQQCKLQQKADSSAFILSACLTSLEPDASLRILPDVVQANNFGRGTQALNQNAQLKTPDDVSCTHIYVFPTSAVTQLPGSNQAGVEEDPYLNQPDAGILPADLLEDIFMDLPGGIMDPTSPSQNPHHFSVGDDDVMNKFQAPGGTERLLSSDVGAVEDLSLLQQPLSLGYMVSTAPPGPLPSWFWSTCPQAKNRCPVFMRSALHIQTSINEVAGDPTLQSQHPLDSSKTSVVLRFVLESYNALSWLTRDPVTRDRRSCLPVHCLSLIQLYHTVENLFYGSVQ